MMLGGTPQTSDGSGVNYSFRAADDANAFHQFQLLDRSRLSSQARERGIDCSPFAAQFIEAFERLDQTGAFRPILFDLSDGVGEGRVVYRDETEYVHWTEYAVNDGVTAGPRPYYSPWQLLYLNDAVRLPRFHVDVEWLLDDQRRQSIPVWRPFLEAQLERWRNLDTAWREVLLLLLRLSTQYGPSIKGSLMKSTVTLVRDPKTGAHVDPRELEPTFDAREILSELGMSVDRVKELHEQLAIHGHSDDALVHWHMLVRMAPARDRATLTGPARRAQDAYDGAEMLRVFYYHLTGDLLLNPDEIFDVSDKSWKRRLFGQWPTLGFTRADLAVELRRHDLHPNQVHIVVEGDTEEIVVRRLLEDVTGRFLNEFGVSMHRLSGVDSAQQQREMLSALKAFPRYVVLIADPEGTIAREVASLQASGVLSTETTFLWKRSFEEDNFSDEELVEMISTLGAAAGATLSLDAPTLRGLYEEHRERVGSNAQGYATFALRKAEQPDYGSVRVSKPQLAELMADRLLLDLRERGEEEAAVDRPLLPIIGSIVRVT